MGLPFAARILHPTHDDIDNMIRMECITSDSFLIFCNHDSLLYADVYVKSQLVSNL